MHESKQTIDRTNEISKYEKNVNTICKQLHEIDHNCGASRLHYTHSNTVWEACTPVAFNASELLRVALTTTNEKSIEAKESDDDRWSCGSFGVNKDKSEARTARFIQIIFDFVLLLLLFLYVFSSSVSVILSSFVQYYHEPCRTYSYVTIILVFFVCGGVNTRERERAPAHAFIAFIIVLGHLGSPLTASHARSRSMYQIDWRRNKQKARARVNRCWWWTM